MTISVLVLVTSLHEVCRDSRYQGEERREREGGTRIETLHITIRHRSRAGDPSCGAAEHPLGYIHYIY